MVSVGRCSDHAMCRCWAFGHSCVCNLDIEGVVVVTGKCSDLFFAGAKLFDRGGCTAHGHWGRAGDVCIPFGDVCIPLEEGNWGVCVCQDLH